ncbi:MAG TPA: MFS transporter [Gemmatimonadales bacterium]|nr:MFS transporter [Gemmatimonadales bacterium]
MPSRMHRWLEAVGLHRPALRAWAEYDLAISGFNSVILTAVFPVYFAQVAAADIPARSATEYFGFTTAFALAIAAVLAPLIGVVADRRGWALRLLAVHTVIGALAVLTLVGAGPGEWRLGLWAFAIANIAATISFSLYGSLLPHLVSADEMDRLSTAGYALGYLGSSILLGIILYLIQHPGTVGLPPGPWAARVGFGLVAVWWLAFSVPLFARVTSPPPSQEGGASSVASFVSRLAENVRGLRQYPEAFLFLGAFLIYNDGIGTIIRMAGIYGAELGIPQSTLIGAILMVQIVGIPCAFGFGALARWTGAKPAILFGLCVYGAISVQAYRMRTAGEFVVLALLVGLVQGGTQALSRSLFASMIPPERSGEFFGLFSVFEKFAGIFGPLVFSLVLHLTGSSRGAILAIVGFFVVGGSLLLGVNVARGTARIRPAATA